MNLKKNPKANLDSYSTIFMQLGLVLALFISILTIEYKTPEKSLITFGNVVINDVYDIDIPEIKIEKPVTPPEIPKAPIILNIVDNKSDEIEALFQPTDLDENKPLILNQIYTIDEVDPEPDEKIPFILIEDAPIFPGCENKSKDQQKKCFSNKIAELVNKKFDTDLAVDLGLTPGKKRIFVMFTIDKYGEIIDVKAKAPHKRLEKEAKRVVKLIPKMTPGKQRGRAVGVKYSLPIVFNIQN